LKKILLIDNTNFINYPTGGTLIFDKQLLNVLPTDKVMLVGITTEDISVRQWTKITIGKNEYDFFPITKVSVRTKKPIIPLRITTFVALMLSLKRIRQKGCLNVFSQTPQFLFALRYFKWDSICFCFAGVGNSIGLSRYRSLRSLGEVYEKTLFKTLKDHVDVILAAADKRAIKQFTDRSKGLIDAKDVSVFPTRFDGSVFRPIDLDKCRTELNISKDKKVLVTTGRLCWVKGWDLLLETIKQRSSGEWMLIFVGDGEDRGKIEGEAADLIRSGVVKITGFLPQSEVVKYINAADVVLTGSYQEGWSTAMIEAIACGKPMVSTDVSGASEIIDTGRNGYILYDRDPVKMARLIDEALNLINANEVSVKLANSYSMDNLFEDFIMKWPYIE
jgi:glycosyltransferase involved in cell wall biosynthesis